MKNSKRLVTLAITGAALLTATIFVPDTAFASSQKISLPYSRDYRISLHKAGNSDNAHIKIKQKANDQDTPRRPHAEQAMENGRAAGLHKTPKGQYVSKEAHERNDDKNHPYFRK